MNFHGNNFILKEKKKMVTEFVRMGLAISLLSHFTSSEVITTRLEQPRFKNWMKNTNLNNPANWDGYESNCSKNIYSFPMDMDLTVISIPPNTLISTNQIILPRNGHLVFQKGPTILFNSPLETCQGTELKFRRTSRSDWFDPNNWNGNDSLLNSEAIPHVERVPCQYDSVQFPSESSFHLFISSDVVVHKFFLGEEELNYTKVAFLMSSQLGQIQFEKASETQFTLNQVNWEDNDKFICKNYETELIRQKICSFMTCRNLDTECENPITPHGFCCPICGYELRIQHNGAFPLAPVKIKLDSRMKSLGLSRDGRLVVSVGRHAQKLAHIVFIPWLNKTGDVGKLIDEIRTFLASDPAVIEATVIRSWEDDASSKQFSSGGSGGITVLIVLLILLILGVIAFLIFLWTKRGNSPPITLTSILSRLPGIPGIGSSPRPSFSFARFSNERVSNINIGATVSGEIQHTEKVDTETKPIEMSVPLEAELVAGIGFTNATYDLCDFGNLEPSTSSKLPQEDEHVYDLIEVNSDSSTILKTTEE